MPVSELSLLTVFITGLLGGVHCAGMCGGIVSALGMLKSSQPESPAALAGIPVTVAAQKPFASSALLRISLYNLGRISMYTLLGTLAGAVGSVAWLMQSILPVQQLAFFLSNVLIILMGLYVLGLKRIAVVVESLGARIWQRIRPAATRRLAGNGFINSITAGALWGMVPCGMVYAVLSAALVSGSAFNGALLMLVFGLGTLPNLMLLGLSGQWLAQMSRRPWVRRIAGLMIISFGLMGLMHLSMMGAMISQ